MPSFDKAELVEKLRGLDHKGQIAFGASCCERLLPNYMAFAAVEKWGDPGGLRKALDQIWNFLEGEVLSSDEIDGLISQCTETIPDSEDFRSMFTGVAQYAAAVLIYTLRSIVAPSLDELAQVGALAVESIEEYLSAVCDPYISTQAPDNRLEEWIQQAPMLQEEYRRQQDDLQVIASWNGSDSDLAHTLRRSSQRAGIQPFQRGLTRE